MSVSNDESMVGMHNSPILTINGVTKKFPGVLALDEVSMEYYPGEILAILGENGAGKSTLMKIISGLYKPDAGYVAIDHSWFTQHTVSNNLVRTELENPRFTMELGIGMVYQHFQLVEPFTVYENITLGDEITKSGIFIDREASIAKVKKISEDFGLPINPEAIVEDLPVGLKQRVEIIKQLYRNSELLILDEPTAVLTPKESEELFATMRKLKDSGKSILFITHKLNEPLEVADRIVVMRQGRVVGSVLPKDATRESLAEMVVGRRVQRQLDRIDLPAGDTVLKVNKLRIVDKFSGKDAVDEVSFELKKNEILGIAGVQGNGQTELVSGIIGTERIEGGEVYIIDEGKETLLNTLSIMQRISQGISYVPEDRGKEGIVPNFSVSENVWLAYHEQEDLAVPHQTEHRGFLSKLTLPVSIMTSAARDIVRRFTVKTPSVNSKIKNLSGGNQQKVIVGREISKNPKILIVNQPTRGVDIGVMQKIHEELIGLRNQGTAILLVSSDLDEVLTLSDRLLVMYSGRKVADGTIDEIGMERLSHLMIGGEEEMAE